jgi:Xaa-Pro dipeptidase
MIKALSLTRAGTRVDQLDAEVRETVRRAGAQYRHHTGHGIGVAHHDLPRLTPDTSIALQAGMVITLEPGAYDPEVGGVRLEAMGAVQPGGCEVLYTPPDVCQQ